MYCLFLFRTSVITETLQERSGQCKDRRGVWDQRGGPGGEVSSGRRHPMLRPARGHAGH